MTLELLRRGKKDLQSIDNFSLEEAKDKLASHLQLLESCNAFSIECDDILLEANTFLKRYPELRLIIDEKDKKLLKVG